MKKLTDIDLAQFFAQIEQEGFSSLTVAKMVGGIAAFAEEPLEINDLPLFVDACATQFAHWNLSRYRIHHAAGLPVFATDTLMRWKPIDGAEAPKAARYIATYYRLVNEKLKVQVNPIKWGYILTNGFYESHEHHDFLNDQKAWGFVYATICGVISQLGVPRSNLNEVRHWLGSQDNEAGL